MVFTQKYTTKWHDTDADRRVRITQMLVYMQETSNIHMESCGPSLDRLRDENKLAFLLSKIRMSIYKPLYAFEDIEVQTWTCDNHGFAIPRFYRIVRNGEVIADADTTWALMDLDGMRLVKGDILADIYDFENEPADSIDVPQRFKLPAGAVLEDIGERRIVYSDLDYNMHMNNTRYADMLLGYVNMDKKWVKHLTIRFAQEAPMGESIRVYKKEEGDVCLFRTVRQDGQLNAEAMFVLADLL